MQCEEAYHCLNIISIDVENRSIQSLGHICAIGGAARLLGISGECNLHKQGSGVQLRENGERDTLCHETFCKAKLQ